jgi:hypothetical protein
MPESNVSTKGLLFAAFLALVGTTGSFFTNGRLIHDLDWLWLSLFASSVMVLSGAAVNFDPKRLIK